MLVGFSSVDDEGVAPVKVHCTLLNGPPELVLVKAMQVPSHPPVVSATKAATGACCVPGPSMQQLPPADTLYVVFCQQLYCMLCPYKVPPVCWVK